MNPPTLTEKTSISFDVAKQHFSKVSNGLHPEYKVDDENKDTIEALLFYFSDNLKFEEVVSIKNPCLQKGIFLAGNIGTGKTLLMRCLRDCSFPNKQFGIKTCRGVAQEFSMDGIKAIIQYGTGAIRNEYGKIKLSNILFDDLGAEQSMSHYGNKQNVMAEIILDRYEHFLSHGLITHFTSNMDLKELEKAYGDRVLSRMYQMLNFVTLGGTEDATDRRITLNVPVRKNV